MICDDKISSINDLLVDTWWYALSKRMSENNFKQLALLRSKQGFSAIQLVVGIPPEIGPKNENAASVTGIAWDLTGNFNENYLKFAYDRIKFLNELGLRVIVYGAWGYQIDWIGKRKMAEWWNLIVNSIDKLDVIYCVTGEVDLWVGKEKILFPDKTTGDLTVNKFSRSIHKIIPVAVFKKIISFCKRVYFNSSSKSQSVLIQKRKDDWGFVLKDLALKTKKPIIIHPTEKTGYDSVKNSELLSANTVQTGHSQKSRKKLWHWPIEILEKNDLFINLEPWYEGIKNDFRKDDQLFAYWSSMLAGSSSFCYGAHGIWNVGEGEFLSHWGKQTFKEAIALDAPNLIGISHKQFLKVKNGLTKTFFTEKNGELICISRKGLKGEVFFFPEISNVKLVPSGRIWLPLEGVFSDELPQKGQVVIFKTL